MRSVALMLALPLAFAIAAAGCSDDKGDDGFGDGVDLDCPEGYPAGDAEH